MDIKDQIITKHFKELGKAHVKQHPELHSKEHMQELAKKAGEVHKQNARKRALIVNLDEPNKNCKTCGADHAFINDDNRASYRKEHEKHLK